MSNQIHLVIPAGSKVLTRTEGLVGIVVQSPSTTEDRYRIRFSNGKEDSYGRSELTIFKHADAEIPGRPDATDLQGFVIFHCIVGSTAYGNCPC